jgi:RNA polymerase sigma factor (sigma-70 family)
MPNANLSPLLCEFQDHLRAIREAMNNTSLSPLLRAIKEASNLDAIGEDLRAIKEASGDDDLKKAEEELKKDLRAIQEAMNNTSLSPLLRAIKEASNLHAIGEDLRAIKEASSDDDLKKAEEELKKELKGAKNELWRRITDEKNGLYKQLLLHIRIELVKVGQKVRLNSEKSIATVVLSHCNRVMLKLAKRLEKKGPFLIKDIPHLRAYIKRMVINQIRDDIRRPEPEITGFLAQAKVDEKADRTLSPNQILEKQERAEQVKRVLETLPKKDRDLILLVSDGMSIKAIAEHLGKTTDQVRGWLFRLRKRLRPRLNTEGRSNVQ